MSSGRGGIKKKQHTKTKQHENEGDEVEKLLRATEDEILLKLSVDSHMSRASSSHIIHPDLDRRFKALRSNSKPASSSKSNSKPASSTAKPTGDTSDAKLNKASVVNDDDDLFARFAALKSTLPSYSKTNEQVEINDGDEEGDEVDEVIRWAIDAAALDPSPPSDDDDVSDNSSDEQTDDDDDEDEDDMKTKEKKKKKGEQK